MDQYDVPGSRRATRVDDATPRHEYHDEPAQKGPEYVECVTDCQKCSDGDAPRGSRLCGECEAEEHREQMMNNRMEMGL